MENINTNQQRYELHCAIWVIADVLCGSIDGWYFKGYVLGMIFYRYFRKLNKLYRWSVWKWQYSLEKRSKTISVKKIAILVTKCYVEN